MGKKAAAPLYTMVADQCELEGFILHLTIRGLQLFLSQIRSSNQMDAR